MIRFKPMRTSIEEVPGPALKCLGCDVGIDHGTELAVCLGDGEERGVGEESNDRGQDLGG